MIFSQIDVDVYIYKCTYRYINVYIYVYDCSYVYIYIDSASRLYAAHYITLQCAATQCITLQNAATRCNTLSIKSTPSASMTDSTKKSYTTEIHLNKKLKLVGTNSNQTKISIWNCTARYRGIWFSRFGGFQGCRLFKRNCHRLYVVCKFFLFSMWDATHSRVWRDSCTCVISFICGMWRLRAEEYPRRMKKSFESAPSYLGFTHTDIYTHTHARTYSLSHTHTSSHTNTNTNTHRHTHTSTPMHTHARTRTHTHTLTRTHMHVLTHAHTCTRTHAHTHTHVHKMK